MKKSIIVILIIALMMTLVSCNGTKDKKEEKDVEEKTEEKIEDVLDEKDEDTSEEKSNDSTKKIYEVGLVAKNQSDQFTAWQANEVINLAEEEYFDKIKIEMIDGAGDNAKILSAMETFISKEVDAILVQPNDTESLIPVINQAYDKGIIVITLSEKVDDEHSTSILSSEKGMGFLLGEKAAEVLPEDAKVVLLEGQPGLSVVVDRTDGIKEGLTSSGREDIEILVIQNADWARDKAMNYMEDWLTLYDQIDGVIAHDDIMLLGAVSAIENAGRKDEFSFLGGIDGLPEGCEAVKEGRTTCSVAQDAPEQAKAALSMAISTLEGGKQEDVVIDTELITLKNVDKWLELHDEQ